MIFLDARGKCPQRQHRAAPAAASDPGTVREIVDSNFSGGKVVTISCGTPICPE